MPYTFMNGSMFSFVSKIGELVFRLSKSDQQEYIEKYNATLSIQHGSVMRGYVNVPDRYFEDREFMLKLCQKSIENAKTLKPKNAKK